MKHCFFTFLLAGLILNFNSCTSVRDTFGKVSDDTAVGIVVLKESNTLLGDAIALALTPISAASWAVYKACGGQGVPTIDYYKKY